MKKTMIFVYISYNLIQHVLIGKKEISLTVKKYQLFTKEKIMEHLWGIDSEFIDINIISVIVSRLKKKLGDESNLIINVFGIGYRMGE